MKLVKNILGRFFAAWAMLTFIITMLIILLPTWAMGLYPEPKRTRKFIALSRIWMAVWLPLAGIRLVIKGKEKFKKGENYVVVCNHNSFMDVPVTSPGIPGANKTIAKKSFVYVPLFGWIYRFATVIVDRKDHNSRKESFDNMVKVLNNGLDMLIYPEGTRNKTTEPLKSFYDGAFKLSVETQKPIIPVVILYTKKILPARPILYFTPGKIDMHILPAIFPQGHTKDSLKQAVYDEMAKYYLENNDKKNHNFNA